MEAAMDVSPLPAVEMNWPSHNKEKSRFLKTAKGDVRARIALNPCFDDELVAERAMDYGRLSSACT